MSSSSTPPVELGARKRKVSARSGARLIQQARARGAQPLHRGGQIGDLKRDVMQSFAALIEKLSDRRIRFGRLQQFDARAFSGSIATFTFSCVHGFAGGSGQAELVLVERQRLIDRAHGDPQVIDLRIK